MKKKEEQLPVSAELLEQFIKVNKIKWKNIKHVDKYIFLNLSMVRMQAAWVIPKLLYAKGLEQETSAKVFVFTWRENPLLSKWIESFGMKHIALNTIAKHNPFALIHAFLKTGWFMVTAGDGEHLKKMKACGIMAGKSIYEDILRTSNLSTIKSARNRICFRKMFHMLWVLFAMDSFCKKYPPTIMVCDDIAYHEGMLIKLFHRWGAVVYSSNNEAERKIHIYSDGEIETNSSQRKKTYDGIIDSLSEDSITWSENYLKERYQGKNGRTIDRGAFADKKVFDRETLQKQYGLDPNKKNVVIMAHTFSDAVFNYGNLYFRDYYDWTEQTIKLAAENTTVNWILKPHPTRNAYNEAEDSIEKMYEKYKKPHIHFLSDEVSAESIRNIADIILTIGGNAGAEFACEGIPVVIVGKPYYCGYGYTIEPENFEAYKQCLADIATVEKLTIEQTNLAKKVFYLRYHGLATQDGCLYHDEFATLVNKKYNQMIDEIALQYFASNVGTQKYNDGILKIITEYFSSHDMTECSYFQRGIDRGKEN